MTIGSMLYGLTLAYVSCGCATALAFLLFGLDRVDPAARGGFAFRPLLVPGLVLLWPLVLLVWRRRPGTATEH
jgi:hypothetical protein